MPLAAPVTDVFAEHPPQLLDDGFPDLISAQLGTPWQETPPMIESVPEPSRLTAGDSPSTRAMHNSVEKPMIR